MNIMNPSVSIVIPMYNAEKHIADVLQAIFKEDYSAQMEVIVVNDGSKDRSLKIVKDFQRKGGLIKVVDHQPNQGAGIATNNGFKAASYDYYMQCGFRYNFSQRLA